MDEGAAGECTETVWTSRLGGIKVIILVDWLIDQKCGCWYWRLWLLSIDHGVLFPHLDLAGVTTEKLRSGRQQPTPY